MFNKRQPPLYAVIQIDWINIEAYTCLYSILDLAISCQVKASFGAATLVRLTLNIIQTRS
jgi:hypothetical protein